MIRILAAFWLSFAVAVPGAQGSSVTPDVFLTSVGDEIAQYRMNIQELADKLSKTLEQIQREKIDEFRELLNTKFACSKKSDPLWYLIGKNSVFEKLDQINGLSDSVLRVFGNVMDSCLNNGLIPSFIVSHPKKALPHDSSAIGGALAEYVQKRVGQTDARSDVKDCHKTPMAILFYQAAKKEEIQGLVQQFSNNSNLINGQLAYAYEPLRPDSSDARITSTTQPLKHLVAMASMLDCAVVRKLTFRGDDELAKEIASTILTGDKFGIDYDRSATQDEFDIFYYSISQAVHYFDFNGLTEHFLGSGYSGLSNGKQKEHRANVFLCAAMAWSHNLRASSYDDVTQNISEALGVQKEQTMYRIGLLHQHYGLGFVADKYIQPEDRN